MGKQILEKLLSLFKLNGPDKIEKFDPISFMSEKYKSSMNKILLEGQYSDSRQVIMAQSEEESKVLPRGILLAQLYTPCNDWLTSIIGTYSDQQINAYSIYGSGVPAYLKERILAKELKGEDFIVSGRFRVFSDVINFLKTKPKNSYHLTRQNDGLWRGKEVYYGFAMVNGSRNAGWEEMEMELRAPEITGKK